jgi:hypothetical protein
VVPKVDPDAEKKKAEATRRKKVAVDRMLNQFAILTSGFT